MANQRKDVPPGWTWRDGRPRWIPSPSLRNEGWKGRDLKDKHGQWLARGPSISVADALAAAVAGWRAGLLVPAAFAASAPDGACKAARAAKAPVADRLSIGALAIAWAGDPDAAPAIPPSPEFAGKALGTQRDYRNKLKRLIDVMAGYAVLPKTPFKGDALAEYQSKVALVRGASIFTLEPREEATGMVDLLHRAYWKLHGEVGHHQANGIMAVASVWLGWCRERQSRTIHNWAAEISRETPPGRIRPATWPELQALVSTADEMGEEGVGDAIVLGVDLSWSETDLLRLVWPRVVEGRALTGTEGRQKTGRVGGTPFTSIGLARLALIRERQAQMKVTPHTVIHLPRQRQHATKRAEAQGDYLRKRFALVRGKAALKLPSVAELTFADMRDTGFTLGREAGLTNDMTASRSLQSRKNINQLADRHYGEISAGIADQGADLLNAYIEKKGLKL